MSSAVKHIQLDQPAMDFNHISQSSSNHSANLSPTGSPLRFLWSSPLSSPSQSLNPSTILDLWLPRSASSCSAEQHCVRTNNSQRHTTAHESHHLTVPPIPLASKQRRHTLLEGLGLLTRHPIHRVNKGHEAPTPFQAWDQIRIPLHFLLLLQMCVCVCVC